MTLWELPPDWCTTPRTANQTPMLCLPFYSWFTTGSLQADLFTDPIFSVWAKIPTDWQVTPVLEVSRHSIGTVTGMRAEATHKTAARFPGCF